MYCVGRPAQFGLGLSHATISRKDERGDHASYIGTLSYPCSRPLKPATFDESSEAVHRLLKWAEAPAP